MSSKATVLAVWLRPLVEYLDGLGVDSSAVFEHTGVDIHQVFVPGVRLPLYRAAPLWKHAGQVTGKPFIAIELANFAPILQGDTVAIAMNASRNLYEALQRFARLSPFLCDAVDVEIVRAGDTLRMDFITHPEDRDDMPHEALEAAFTPILSFLSKGVVSAETIRCLEFERDYPGKDMVAHLQDMFPVPMEFGCKLLAMICDWTLCQKQNPYWNPALAQMSESLALESIEQLNADNIVARVKKLLIDLLPDGKPQQGKVARLLNVSKRSFQRKLEEKGLTYSEVLRETRHDLACRYLQDARMTLIDIAFSLGFQDQSNFVRAFRQWHGKTPGQFRKELVS